jgi:imidazolonepropionase-like amidohydrolase
MSRTVLALAAFALLAVSLAAQPTAPPPVLLEGARILDAAGGRYLAPAFVLIRDGRIVSITPDEPSGLSSDVQRLSLKDATLVPGFVDARATAAPADGLDVDYYRLTSLAYGVTAERAFNLRAAWGAAQKRRLETGETLGPRLFAGGRGIDQGARPDLWLFDAPDADAVTQEAQRQIASGPDWLAGYQHLPPASVRALVGAARGTSVRVSAIPGASSMSELAAAGVHAIDTLQWPLAAGATGDPAGADAAWTAAAPRELATLARRLATARVALVPMMAALLSAAFPDTVEQDDFLKVLPAGRRDTMVAQAKTAKPAEVTVARRAWAARTAFLATYVKAGGRVVTGTGSELSGVPAPGFGIHRELAALVRAGLTPAQAIRAATANGAELLNAAHAIGAIAPGRGADFVIVTGDPLVSIGDLAKITHVVRRGEVLDPKALLARAKR